MAFADSEIRQDEYRFLRGELDTNKKFVFERPLLIIGAGVGLSGGLHNADAIYFAPILFLAVLYFNLWFTDNRLRSSARIIAYLQLIHESRELVSSGWELALIEYRTKEADQEIQKNSLCVQETNSERDPMRFYPPIFYFHVLIGGTAAAAMAFSGLFFRGLNTGESSSSLIVVGMNGISIILFVLASFKFRPSGPRSGVAYSREVWKAALKRTETKN